MQKKAYPIVGSTAEKAREAADTIAASGDYDLIFVDLPGTVESTGVFRTIVNMDYVLTPTIPDLIVMQSTLAFATTVLDHIKKMENTPLLKDIFFFWNKLKKRTNVEILKSYSEVMRELHLTVLDSTLPDLCRYEKEITHAKRAFSVARCCRLQPDNWKAAVWWNLRKSLWSNLNLDSHEKKIVEVDEDVLKEIIVGDIPVSARTAPPRKKSPWNIRKRKAPPQPYRQILQRKSPPWRSPKGKG